MLRLSVSTAVVLLACVATTAIAQQQTPAPSQGNGSVQGPAPTAPEDGGARPPWSRGNGAMFRGADSASRNRPRTLDLAVTLTTAYDDDLSEGQRASAPGRSLIAGEFSDVSAMLSFARNAPRLRAAARAGSSMRHYPSLDRFVGSSHLAGADLALQVDRRTTVQASADGAYVSEFAFDTISRQSGLGNAALAASGLDVARLDGARLSYGAAVGLTRKVGLQSTLSLNLGARTSERRMFNESGAEQTMGGHFTRNIARSTSIGIGYALRNSSQRLGAETQPAWTQDIQAGIDHSWRHASERRTVLSLFVGPSLLHVPVKGQAGENEPVRLAGSVALSHDMSRSWNLGTSYRRGAGSIDGVRFDTATVDVHGLLNRRADLTISAGYSRTDLGLGIGQSRYTTAFGSGRLQVALTRAVAMYGQYVLYNYDFGTAILATGQLAQQQRRGVRAGLTLWMPLREGR